VSRRDASPSRANARPQSTQSGSDVWRQLVHRYIAAPTYNPTELARVEAVGGATPSGESDLYHTQSTRRSEKTARMQWRVRALCEPWRQTVKLGIIEWSCTCSTHHARPSVRRVHACNGGVRGLCEPRSCTKRPQPSTPRLQHTQRTRHSVRRVHRTQWRVRALCGSPARLASRGPLACGAARTSRAAGGGTAAPSVAA
jgi:hypothetical protein